MKVKVFVFQPFDPIASEEVMNKWADENLLGQTLSDVHVSQTYSIVPSQVTGQMQALAMFSVWYIPKVVTEEIVEDPK
jgi:hypothetical protein